ncbi:MULTISPECIES: ABC transporter ATP-binding protein [Priestia]|jgi:ABC-type multidrug transport system ATPase subunit|uniref:ABC transporter ATP-binding protein n=1 Tax=Priestia TaxID=2800373 RepID=UPI001EC0610D|nr:MULTISPECIES: ATP-binding cassette domain-containing protein [Priestia]MBY0089659.1 ATP-binding cassette domain-containing protein [Priestia aryabhattai]MBY0100752.1 ATP-binding cassette domain-containing protein [Priestia aryabhattai]MCM3303894.1 ATP-binding cassette domain-containing protein [Priestia megaterium]MED4029252.1 ATP-binding cassette domain-containing protein [Priestia megaterium]MED4137470.1 ATP-binding cassette domain-containing protein [Priestia megaterium]
MKNIILDVKSVSKKVRRRHLVKEVSFQINEGEICGLLGPNGAGKTTLIRLLTGLIKPTGGEVFINNKHIVSQRKEALQNVGAIVESPIFFPYMTGKENLTNLARLHSFHTKQKRQQRVKEVLDIVGLTGRENDKVRTYSLGMKQRLGIAQALLGDPDLLILDEPANGLDPMGVRELRELLFTLKRDYNKTILISSHLLDELQRVCDQIVVMREGELIWDGALDQLASGKNLEDAFVELVSQ